MKTGGEKHDIWRDDTHWNCMTPINLQVQKSAKKDRVKSYKRNARRFVKKLTRLFKSKTNPNDIDI